MHRLSMLLLSLFLFIRPDVVSAETVNCVNITSLPATITSQGVYCLKQDLSTGITSGFAIDIQANNVTLDCNGYKIGGLAAGPATTTSGVHAFQINNVTVRNCTIRGFQIGIDLSHNGVEDPIRPIGHVIERNRLDLNTRAGIYISGDASVVRNNSISATGGNTIGELVVAIHTMFNTDVIDNTIDGVSDLSPAPLQVYGVISWYGAGNVVSGNRVRGLHSSAGTNGILTTLSEQRMSVRGNTIVNELGSDSGYGIHCLHPTVIASDNHISGFSAPLSGCAAVSSNNAVSD